MLGVRLDSELEKRLTVLAKRTHRSKSHHAKAALARYIEQEKAKNLADKESLSRWEAYKKMVNLSVINLF